MESYMIHMWIQVGMHTLIRIWIHTSMDSLRIHIGTIHGLMNEFRMDSHWNLHGIIHGFNIWILIWNHSGVMSGFMWICTWIYKKLLGLLAGIIS